MRRIHIKGDVACTLILLVLLCILLYVHQSLIPTWEAVHIKNDSAISKDLLEATAKACSCKIPDVPQCSSGPELQAEARPSKVLKTPVKLKKRVGNNKTPTKASVSPTPFHFDFEGYLRKKDQREFEMLINQPEKCSGPEGAPYLLIAIKSVAADFDKRQVVRRTWGREGVALNGVSIMTVFLLGVPQNATALPVWDKLLTYESRAFRDILLWNFEDTFFNLTLKETHFLRWVNTTCSKAKFIFKGDVDVYVNIENILEMLGDREADRDLFIGDIIIHAKPIRRRSSKYFVPEFMYGQGMYPSYAGGGGFVMSGHTALRLHMACKEVELFPIDDVFLGMCLLRLGLQPTRHKGFRTFGIVRPSAAPRLQVYDPCFYKHLMVVHDLTVPQIWLMWNLLHDPGVHCHSSQAAAVLPFRWRDKTPDTAMDTGKRDYELQVFVKH